MADPVQTVLILAMVITLIIVMILELRLLRSRRKKKMEGLDLPDRAHNAILTSKAIAATLARGGVRSAQADDLIQEAEDALRDRKYRVAIDLADNAKAVLRAAKQRYAAEGDVAKAETLSKKEGAAEGMTEKERLMKEMPPNYMQSRFSISMARTDIDAAKAQGRDVAEAERLLAEGQKAFDAQDFDEALRQAVRARRSVGGVAAPAAESAAAPATAKVPAKCPSCGTAILEGDAFCRKCGAKAPIPRVCRSCKSLVADGDGFCRSCGTPFEG